MLLCKDYIWLDTYLKGYGYSIEKQMEQFYITDFKKRVLLKQGEKIELFGGICPIVLECVSYQKEKMQLNILVYDMKKKTKLSICENTSLQISMQDETHRFGMDLSLYHMEFLEGNVEGEMLKNRTLVYENDPFSDGNMVHLQAQYMDAEMIYGVFHNCFFNEQNDHAEERYDYIENQFSTNEKKQISISDLDSLSFFVGSVLSKKPSVSLFRDVVKDVIDIFPGIEEYLKNTFPIFKEFYQNIYMKQK